MRMSRFSKVIPALLLLVANVSVASPLDKEMREVEKLRGLSFLHDVTQRTIDRSELRPLIRQQLAKSIPYSIEEYVRILQSLQFVDASAPDVIERMFKLYDSQVLAFYDPMSHTYFAIRQLPESLASLGRLLAFLAPTLDVSDTSRELRGRVGDRVHLDAVEIGLARLEVLRVALEHEALLLPVLLEHERPGAHHGLRGGVIARAAYRMEGKRHDKQS